MVDRPAERETDEDAAEQVGDDLPGLAGRRVARRLRGGVTGRARLQVGCAFLETSDRLFAVPGTWRPQRPDTDAEGGV